MLSFVSKSPSVIVYVVFLVGLRIEKVSLVSKLKMAATCLVLIIVQTYEIMC